MRRLRRCESWRFDEPRETQRGRTETPAVIPIACRWDLTGWRGRRILPVVSRWEEASRAPSAPSETMALTNEPPDLLPGTLDMLILRALVRGAMHGYGIAERVRQVSEDVLQV